MTFFHTQDLLKFGSSGQIRNSEEENGSDHLGPLLVLALLNSRSDLEPSLPQKASNFLCLPVKQKMSVVISYNTLLGNAASQAGEMAQWVQQCLLHQQQVLSSDPWCPHKMPGVAHT